MSRSTGDRDWASGFALIETATESRIESCGRRPLQQIGSERIRHKDGHGLGLAVAQAHGAKLAAHARAEGGLPIDVTFPTEPPPIRKA